MKTILLLGAAGPAGSNFIQCLRRHNFAWYIIAVDSNSYHLALLKGASEKHLMPPNLGDWWGEIDRLVKEQAIDLIWAQPDPVVDLLSSLSPLRDKMFMPSPMVITICQDKLETHLALKQAKQDQPETEYLGKYVNDMRQYDMRKFRRAVTRMLLNKADYPVWVRYRHGSGSKASIKAYTYEQVMSWMDYWGEEKNLRSWAFLVQEFLPGPEYAWQSVWNKGELVCSAARERLEYLGGAQSPTGQTSSPSVAVSVHNDEVNEAAARAVRVVCEYENEPHGVFCVDLKTNSKGQVCVTEINAGRFFTTSNFFAEAGCNMPRLAVMLGCGMDPGPHKPYNAVPAGLYWIRQPDMGYTLLDGKPEFPCKSKND